MKKLLTTIEIVAEAHGLRKLIHNFAGSNMFASADLANFSGVIWYFHSPEKWPGVIFFYCCLIFQNIILNPLQLLQTIVKCQCKLGLFSVRFSLILYGGGGGWNTFTDMFYSLQILIKAFVLYKVEWIAMEIW